MLMRLRRCIPALATMAVVALSVALPVAIFLTAITIQWVAFLVGVLVAASLALASRSSHARWLIARRTAQLRVARERLGRETQARVAAQRRLAELESTVRRPGRVMPPASARDDLGGVLPLRAASKQVSPDLPKQAERQEARERIGAALVREDFSLYLQDIVRVNPGWPVAQLREVLLRLDEEEEGHLPAGTFLDLAADCGMMPALDAWQVAAAARWLGSDGARRLVPCVVSVSAAALRDAGFAKRVREALRNHHVAAETLCLAVAACDLDADLPDALSCLSELQREGCRVALSGFGGASSAPQLVRAFSPDYVRIDGGIVVALSRDPRQEARICAINRVAHAVGAATIAECIEDAHTLARIVALGVDFVQGSFISSSSPLRAQAFARQG